MQGTRHSVTAREITRFHFTCIGENNTVATAAKQLSELNVGALPICGEDHNLKGMLTEHDIVTKVLAKGADPTKMRAGEVGVAEPVTIDADDPLDEALSTMSTCGSGCLPVVDGHELIGVVSRADVLRNCDLDRVPDFLASTSV
jgi:CBS domain-containing protein